MLKTAFIFARGGSKGVPGKNIKLFSGKPLIAWSIQQALAVKSIGRVIVSTDSLEIAEIAKLYGASVPFIRPAELADDFSPEWASWRHALKTMSEIEGQMPEDLISIPATSPLRDPVDILNCLEMYENDQCDAVIGITETNHNPYFNMVIKDDYSNKCKIVIQSKEIIGRRQDTPNIYNITTVAYVINSEFIMRNNSILDGCYKGVIIPSERAMDIDSQLEFDVAEFLFRKKNGFL